MANELKRRTSEVLSNNPKEKIEEEEIDLLELWNLFKKKIGFLVLLVVIGGGVAFSYSRYMITPTYSSSGSIYLTPLVNENGIADYTSLNSNSKLVSNVMTLLQQKDLLTEVAEESGIDSVETIRKYLKITNVDNTEVINITATTEDPRLSKKIVKNIINLFIDMMKDNLNVKNIEIVNSPSLNFKPVGPNVEKYTALGVACGAVIYAMYLVFVLLTDNHIRTKEQAEKYLGLPVIGEFPKEK